MKDSIIQEGLSMQEVADRAKEKKIPVYNYPNFGGSKKTRIIRGVLIGRTKIWIPKEYRTTSSELNYDVLKKMKLKKMIMYNNEIAYFLVE